MSPLVLTPEQEEILRGAPSTVPLQNSEGRIIGTVIFNETLQPQEPIELDPETIEILAQRMSMENIRWRTTEEVLQRLDEIDRRCSE